MDRPCPAPAAGALELGWLPPAENWTAMIKHAESRVDPTEAWDALVALANTRMDFVRTVQLDRVLRARFGEAPPPGLATEPVRLAALGSSTLTHRLAAIRVGALRRNMWLTAYEGNYGQYFQELHDTACALNGFAPNAVLFAFDAPHLIRGTDGVADLAQAEAILRSTLRHLADCWRLAHASFRCQVIQQTALPVFSPVLGNNEHRLPGSPARLTAALNARLREAADEHGVDLLALDTRVAVDGLARWHHRGLWHSAKQEISPAAAPLYGDLVGRLLAARRGRSAKCLVLDLDNTLWGGVVGDDGPEGIVLGQGSALGEAFVGFQTYARALSQRGVILAVVSKNEEANALAPFDHHPEMVLKRDDIACFVANWHDKASNIRAVAEQLNIGVDALVFVDDNPFERNLVRRELPMVAVPELPDDPALFAACLADAGYFEGLAVTEEDRARGAQYQGNLARDALQRSAADMSSYLRSLGMRLVWRHFDRVGVQRIAQLINKTNQFNLTTRRYTEDNVVAVMHDMHAFGVQFRLVDRFGDNGIIAITIGRKTSDRDVVLDTWLMSCRVLGRQVEEATLAVVAEEARRLGARRLIGEYRPTAKNGMVRDHYTKLGFTPYVSAADGRSQYALELCRHVQTSAFIQIQQG